MLGNKFRQGLRPVNAFPKGIQGKDHPSWKQGDPFTCRYCQDIFHVKPWRLRRRSNPQFCSIRCQGAYRKKYLSAENAPDYVGGPKTYRGKGWLEARAKAVERDNETCQRCKKVVGSSIPVHHIRPFREFTTIEEANQLNNLICLCQSCHMKIEPRTYKVKT